MSRAGTRTEPKEISTKTESLIEIFRTGIELKPLFYKLFTFMYYKHNVCGRFKINT